MILEVLAQTMVKFMDSDEAIVVIGTIGGTLAKKIGLSQEESMELCDAVVVRAEQIITKGEEP